MSQEQQFDKRGACRHCAGTGYVTVREVGTHAKNHGELTRWQCNHDGTFSAGVFPPHVETFVVTPGTLADATGQAAASHVGRNQVREAEEALVKLQSYLALHHMEVPKGGGIVEWAINTLEHYRYSDAEHESLGCPVAKTGIYAPSTTPQKSERVPICGTKGGTVSRAIWDEAWIAYAKKYGGSESQHKRLLNEGFYDSELDELRPGWRPVDQRIVELERELAFRNRQYDDLFAMAQKEAASAASATRHNDDDCPHGTIRYGGTGKGPCALCEADRLNRADGGKQT